MISVFILVIFNAYFVDGYFYDPIFLHDHIITTDNHCSAIYAIENGQIEILVSSPGCGRYYSISPDQRNIGFKLINARGLQSPALYDLVTGSIRELRGFCSQAGQVSFSNTGKIAFTVGSELIVMDNSGERHFDLGTYANLAPISPDGQYVVYNDEQDDLWIMALKERIRKCITVDLDGGFCYPKWSSDSRYFVFSNLQGHIYVYDLSYEQVYYIGEGMNPDWSPDNQYLIYHRVAIDGMVMTGSDLYLSKYDGSEQFILTATPDIHEMDPAFCDNQNTVCYHIYDRREICLGKIENRTLIHEKTVFASSGPVPFIKHKFKTINGARDSIDVPYYHQVYDVPDWFNGHWACAPTTAIMAIAYYNKLPEWNCWCSNPYGHNSSFGRYLCELYHYREIDYNLQAQDPSGNWASGGYGYMWAGSNRPYTHMAPFLSNHDIVSWRDVSPTFAETIAEVNAGYPYGMCVGLTASGHLVLAVGQVWDWHTLIFNDPYGNKNTPGYPSYDGKYVRYDWPGYNNGCENLDYVYWCVGAQGDWEPATDTIVDDLQFAGGFYLHTEAPSSMVYWHDVLTGYNGHAWWTYTTAATYQDTCYAVWTPVLTTLGDYNLYAYIPESHADATAARYHINAVAGSTMVTIDQSGYSDEWVPLGMFGFIQGSAYVRLGDATGTQGQRIAFDAMNWEYLGPGIDEFGASTPPTLVSLKSNPVKRFITLNTTSARESRIDITLFDITGRCVYDEKDISPSYTGEVLIDVSDLPSGVYILRTSIDHQNIYHKCIILQ
ncbi:MAG: T9SS type A sorting domain-containing protein [bacterium]